jgi:hypothetical protein
MEAPGKKLPQKKIPKKKEEKVTLDPLPSPFFILLQINTHMSRC